MFEPPATDWNVVPLASLVEDPTSGDWGSASPAPGLVECRVIRGTDFEEVAHGNLNDVPIRYLSTKRIHTRSLAAGDVLVEMSGGSEKQATGRALLITEDGLTSSRPIVYSNFVKRIRPAAGHDPQFIRYLWEWLYRRGHTRTYEQRTTGIRNFKLEAFLENELVAAPPQHEQMAIAAVLRSVEQAMAATELVIATSRQLKRSLLRDLFSQGAASRPDIDALTAESEAGAIPARWTVVPLGEVLRQITNGTTLPQQDEPPGHPVSRIQTLTDDGLNPAKVKYIRDMSADELARFGLAEGDLLVSHINSEPQIGRTALYRGRPPGLIHGMNLLRLVVDRTRLQPEYLLHLFDWYRRRGVFVRLASRAVGQSSINQGRLKAMLVPVPDLTEQASISRILSAVDLKIAVEEQRSNALDALFAALLGGLMTGRNRAPVGEDRRGAP